VGVRGGRERGAVLGGVWRVGPTRPGGGDLTTRAGRGVLAGGLGRERGAGQAAAGPPSQPKAGRGASWAARPRLGRAQGGKEREEAGSRQEAELGREGGFSIFPFFL
jgi:hypothetical protein